MTIFSWPASVELGRRSSVAPDRHRLIRLGLKRGQTRNIKI
jgi:hypothetical protein